MKLPEARIGGVQSLGREDISGPARKWRSEVQAQNAMAGAFKELGNVFTALTEAEDVQTLYDRIEQDKTTHARSLEYLRNTRVINLDDEESDVPDDIRKYAQNWLNTNRKEGEPENAVETYKIADGYVQEMHKKTRAESMAAIKSKKLRDKYSETMMSGRISDNTEALGIQVKQRTEKLKFKADQQYNDAIKSMDVNLARQVADTHLANGVWDQQTYIQKTQNLESDIYILNTHERILNAQSDFQIQQLQDEILSGRNPASPEQRIQLIAAMDKQDARIDEQRTENHNRTMQDAYTLYDEGTLDLAKVNEWVKSDQITFAQANTLRGLLITKSKQSLEASPQTIEFFQREINNMRFFEPGTDSMIENRDSLLKTVRAASNGYYDDGTLYQGPRVSFQESANLQKTIIDTYNGIQSNPSYKRVLDMARKYTQTDGLVDLTKATNNVKAYNALKSSLDRFYDINGYSADLEGWYEQNYEKFNPIIFKSTDSNTTDIKRLQVHGVPGQFFSTDQEFTPTTVQAWAVNEYDKGKISETDYYEIGKILYGHADPQPFSDYLQAERQRAGKIAIGDTK